MMLLYSTQSNAAQDTLKILFVGNSFTYNFDLPGLFDSLAKNAGYPVVIAQHTPGGVSVGDTSQGTMAHMNNPEVFSMIRSNNWDYLLLQDNQGRFVHDYGVFPASSLVIEGHIRIRDSLLFHHPCAHMLWFAGFGPKAGYPPYANTGSGLIDKIYNNYRFLLDTAGQVIAPLGPAWQKIIANNTSINLWDVDDTHPGLAGSYLNACVVYATVFKQSPILSSFNPGISAMEDSILKTTAWQTTIDSIYVTGLKQITPEISQIDAVAFVWGSFDTCYWYRNDTLVYIGNSLFIPVDGPYYAITKDNNGCTFRTLTSNLSNINSVNELTQKDVVSRIFPNPANDVLNIFAPSNNTRIRLMNSIGQSVFEEHLPSSSTKINCSSWPAGAYIICFITDEKQILYRKLIIVR
ncbi:MAG: T9SS type A sorting domain-containing protein [Bacteroidota bacterium]